MDPSYKEMEEWESRLPEDRLSALFVATELNTGDREIRGVWRFLLFKQIGFRFKGSASPRYAQTYFSSRTKKLPDTQMALNFFFFCPDFKIFEL